MPVALAVAGVRQPGIYACVRTCFRRGATLHTPQRQDKVATLRAPQGGSKSPSPLYDAHTNMDTQTHGTPFSCRQPASESDPDSWICLCFDPALTCHAHVAL